MNKFDHRKWICKKVKRKSVRRGRLCGVSVRNFRRRLPLERLPWQHRGRRKMGSKGGAGGVKGGAHVPVCSWSYRFIIELLNSKMM